MVEILVAILVLVVAVLGVASALISSQTLSLAAERGASITQRAQGELERLEALPYGSLAMSSAPTPSSDPTSPDYYVSSGSPATFAWDRNSSNSEPLVVDATNGLVSGTPTAWSDGRLSGQIYDFVTWHTDAGCGSGCPAANDYKRITVEVTLSGASEPKHPALVSAIVVDPNAAPAGFVSNGTQNPLQSPSTSCINAQGVLAPCSNGLGNGTPNTWFLYDTPATSTYAAPTANHPTHTTVAVPPSGTCNPTHTADCPVPDLMGSAPPTGSAGSQLYNYSSEQTADSFTGGRILKTDVGCSSTPSATDNTKGELWVSAPLASSTTLTGDGGMTIYSQTANNAAASVTFCIGIYDVPNSLTNLVTGPPTELGAVSYTSPSWPTALSPLSLPFDFLASGATKTIAAGDRVGVRVWVASSGGADVAIAYDNPNYASLVELNAQ
jgi:hypothetical protein